MRGKNVKNELGAINYPRMDYFLDIALLGSRQIMVEEKQVGGGRRGTDGDFF